jgi:hypothetical protein
MNVLESNYKQIIENFDIRMEENIRETKKEIHKILTDIQVLTKEFLNCDNKDLKETLRFFIDKKTKMLFVEMDYLDKIIKIAEMSK